MFNHLSAYFTQSEEDAVADLLSNLNWDSKLAEKSEKAAVDLIKRIRKTRRKSGSLESFFQQYALNTDEGLALMSMAEALLRIPDSKTASALIRDKVAGTNWLKSGGKDKDWMTRAAGLGLKLTSGTMNSLFSKLGEPVIREAMGKTMKMMGKQFVIGETLDTAQKTASGYEEKGYRLSYDMLGEGARTARDAARYFESYKAALETLAQQKKDKKKKSSTKDNGISVKLSALHPRFETAKAEICIPDVTNCMIELCDIAAKNNITLTIDAEEVSRLHMTLKIVENISLQHQFKKWQGLGVVVQAYQKAAPAIIDSLITLAKTHDRKLNIRLVRGAYWDTEIKYAQVEGLDDYPVYTRKSNTDVSYLRCVQKLLRNRDVLYPMFGTHNAYSVAAVLALAGKNKKGFEFQKLHGMGEALYNCVLEDYDIPVCIYAPVGPYEDLLPYLVRRMLENGANSSFVNQVYDRDYKPEDIATDPVEKCNNNEQKSHPKIPLPLNLFGDIRKNSRGINFGDPAALQKLQNDISQKFLNKEYQASPFINGKNCEGILGRRVFNPADREDQIGQVFDTKPEQIDKAFNAAKTGYKIWSATSAKSRAEILITLSSLLEDNTKELISLALREGGRTLKDAHDEVREAVDFCRYYAAHGIKDFDEQGRNLKSSTGEDNIYKLCARGIFICIAPWNFPIAIFTGQIVAALMAGNSVIAKPAEQTSLTGYFIIQLIIKAGIPPQALSLLPGDGNIGAMIVDHKDVVGVAFTGSTDVARNINQALAAKQGAIPKLIAETGGQNAMIVDSSALTEQVVDDVIQSAFGSAGQRCSACRVLYLQEDIADKTILMLQGALKELQVGNPFDLTTDLGPLIDEEAHMHVQHHKTRLAGFGRKLAEVNFHHALVQKGNFFAPAIYEIDTLDALDGEVFGPILHVIRYKHSEIDQVIDDINESGYGLTFGVHSRVQSFIDKVTSRLDVGNVYVNRGTIGAVVGVQPFGGHGLSGTGPKAGGPLYLHAFATEKVISIDTTAAGGNASLVMIDE